MKNQIIRLDEENRKVFGFNDEQLIFSSKGHKTFESLESAAVKPGLLETLKTIDIDAVKAIEYNESEEGFTIIHDKKGKNKKEGVGIKNSELREGLVKELASLKGFNPAVVEEKKIKPLLFNLFWIVLVGGFTVIARGMAIDAQNGEHYVATGRKRGIAQLITDTIESIGPLWVTIIGVVCLLYTIYNAYKRYNNPSQEIKYS